MTDPRLLLVDILEHARRVQRYAAEGHEAYEASTMIQDAILRNLEVIGEAAKDVDAVWEASQDSVPDLIPRIEAILRELGVDPDEVP